METNKIVRELSKYLLGMGGRAREQWAEHVEQLEVEGAGPASPLLDDIGKGFNVLGIGGLLCVVIAW